MYRIVINKEQIQAEKIILTSKQEHYLSRVVRLNSGDRFVAMDGEGKAYLAQLAGTTGQIIELLDQESPELSIAVTLMVALPKGNGFADIIRCCTELGVKNLWPIISDRTIIKPSSHKQERWVKIAQEAAEQSERLLVPNIVKPMDLATALAKVDKIKTDCYICVARGDVPHLLPCLEQASKQQIIIATGPEGGWTEEEIAMAISSGFQPVSLGRRILRAITAPIVALSIAAAKAET